MNTVINIRDLLLSRIKGNSLAAAFYTNKEIFDFDLNYIFGRHWIYVAVECDIPEAGDYLTVQIGNQPILIVRDDDNEIRAFHNVCRHRGSRLCTEEKGMVGNLVCPYHQWTYNLKGQLLFAEHMGADFDPSKHRLKQIHLKNISGLIFICLADEPPKDIDDMARAMSPYIGPHKIADCKVAYQSDIIEAGNWKLVMENNRECYHCRGSHPELTASLYEYGFGYAPSEDTTGLDQFKELVRNRHAHWESCGLPSKEIEHLDDRITGFRTLRLPLDKAGESQTLNGAAASKKLLGNFTEAALGGLSFGTQPNSWHHFMSDHIVTFSVTPLSPGETLVRTKWLVHKDAVEGKDYSIENLTAVWNATNAQDRALVEESYRGAMSPAYQPGPYSPYTEALVEKFCNWYIGRLLHFLG